MNSGVEHPDISMRLCQSEGLGIVFWEQRLGLNVGECDKTLGDSAEC